jgi:hypothetical protein
VIEATAVDIQNTLQQLAETAQHFRALSSPLTSEQLRYRLDKKSWSFNDILAHLRACADVWGASIEAMLAQDNPTLRHLSPRTYMKKTDYPQQEFHTSLVAFSQQREQLLAQLQSLETADWSRGAIIKDRRTPFSARHGGWPYMRRLTANS